MEACQLKTKMAEIQKDIFHVHKETSACMANLERLDSMKTKLQVSNFASISFSFERMPAFFFWVKTTETMLQIFEPSQ